MDLQIKTLIDTIIAEKTPGGNTKERIGTVLNYLNTAKSDTIDTYNKDQTLTLINEVKSLAVSGAQFLGNITDTTILPEGDIWAFAEPGNYPGSVIVNPGELGIISRVKDVYSVSILSSDIDSSIPQFQSIVFPVSGNIQTIYDGAIYELKVGQTATNADIPSEDVSSKWQPLGITTKSTFQNYISPTLEVGALALNTGSAAASTTRGRTSAFLDINYAYKIELLGDMLFQNIFYYTETNVFISTQVINGKTFTPTIPGTAKKFKFSLYHTTNTQTVLQSELDALTINCYSSTSTSFLDILASSKASAKIVSDYESLDINLGYGVYKELGGINVTDGSDANNNIRIRTEKIPVSSGSYHLTQDAGYIISRVVNYKNGVFVNYGSLGDFTINSDIVNEIRLVWSKTNATVVITQAEVDAFKFNLQKLNANKFDQLLEKIDQSETEVSTWFANKKMSSLGDSITYGFIPRNYIGYPGQLDSYAKQAAALLGMSWENKGISGSTLGQISASDTTTRDPMVNRYAAMAADAKVITFMGGTNDLRNISNLGTMSDRVKETYYGALHLLIQGLLNKYIYAQSLTIAKDIIIVGLTPIKIYPDSTHNSLKMTNYVAAMKEVCAYYSIPCFDAYNMSGLTPGDFRTLQGTEPGYTDMYNPLITDGVHPTKEGNAIFAARFAGFLKTLIY